MAESNKYRACNKISLINATFYAFIGAQMPICVATILNHKLCLAEKLISIASVP